MAREQMGLQATLRKAVQKVVGISKTTFSFVYLRAFLTLASFKYVQIMTLKLPRVQFAKSSSLEPPPAFTVPPLFSTAVTSPRKKARKMS